MKIFLDMTVLSPILSPRLLSAFLICLFIISCDNDKEPVMEGIKLKELYIHTALIDDVVEDVKATLEVVAKDKALGAVLWQGEFQVNTSSLIQIPEIYDYYVFKVRKDDFLTHAQYVEGDYLSDIDHLNFDLISNTKLASDFYIYGYDPIKVYIPKDPCKLYGRIDAPEGYRITYAYVDRAAYDINESVIDHIYPDGLSVGSCDNEECIRLVNLYDNRPYHQSEEFCQHILLPTEAADSMDDLVIDCIMQYHYIPAGGTSLDKRSETFVHFYQEGSAEGKMKPGDTQRAQRIHGAHGDFCWEYRVIPPSTFSLDSASKSVMSNKKVSAMRWKAITRL